MPPPPALPSPPHPQELPADAVAGLWAGEAEEEDALVLAIQRLQHHLERGGSVGEPIGAVLAGRRLVMQQQVAGAGKRHAGGGGRTLAPGAGCRPWMPRWTASAPGWRPPRLGRAQGRPPAPAGAPERRACKAPCKRCFGNQWCDRSGPSHPGPRLEPPSAWAVSEMLVGGQLRASGYRSVTASPARELARALQAAGARCSRALADSAPSSSSHCQRWGRLSLKLRLTDRLRRCARPRAVQPAATRRRWAHSPPSPCRWFPEPLASPSGSRNAPWQCPAPARSRPAGSRGARQPLAGPASAQQQQRGGRRRRPPRD